MYGTDLRLIATMKQLLKSKGSNKRNLNYGRSATKQIKVYTCVIVRASQSIAI